MITLQAPKILTPGRVAQGLMMLLVLVGADIMTVRAQTPTKCATGTIAIEVPRPHIAGITGPGLPVRDALVTSLSKFSATTIVTANPGMRLSAAGTFPTAYGGRVCVATGGTKVAKVGVVLQEVPPTVTRASTSVRPRRGQLTDAQIATYARAAGFRGIALVTAVTVALAESGGITNNRNTNRGGSVDRGLMQINDRAWPDISTATADDPAKAMAAAWMISHHGTNWSPWCTWNNRSKNPRWGDLTARAERASG
jgi:hypothetical protein